VFLSPTFFGGSFQTAFALRSPEITALMKEIYKGGLARMGLRHITQHDTYQAVLRSGIIHSSQEWFLEQAVNKMIQAVNGYRRQNWDYIIEDGRLLYKPPGRQEYGNWTYEYNDNCSYLYEHQQGTLTEAQVNACVGLWGCFGQFAYATLTDKVVGMTSFYRHVLGVTGTLEASKLPPNAHTVLKEDIQIGKYTYCPTMYGELKRDFKETRSSDVQVTSNDSEHKIAITEEIMQRLAPLREGMDGQRSVIIFFETKEELMRYYECAEFSRYKETAKLMFEGKKYLESIIEGATVQGAVTLATRSFGRGTDFKVFDQRMLRCGGVHILLTFYPKEISELVQIMGRGSRQGDAGSFSMVMCIPAIVKALNGKVTARQIQQWASGETAQVGTATIKKDTVVYEKLAAVRDEIAKKEMSDLRTQAAQRKVEHNECARAITRCQQGGDAEGMKALMQRYN